MREKGDFNGLLQFVSSSKVCCDFLECSPQGPTHVTRLLFYEQVVLIAEVINPLLR
jgi:hypothetical protein